MLLILSLGCKPQSEPSGSDKNVQETFKNVVILLDLSNRVSLQNQMQKDQELISTVLSSFEQRQRKYAFQISKDKLSLALAYQSSSPYNLYNIGNNRFMINMEHQPGQQMNKPKFDEKVQDFKSAVTELYEKVADAPTDGADIWGFFCTDWSNIYQKDKQNKVIILTDGYLDFDQEIRSKRPKGTYMRGLDRLRNKSDWEQRFQDENLKLNKCEMALENTEVLILEVAPRDKNIFTNEFQIIEKFWLTWFNDMNTHAEIYQTDDINANINQKIAEFIGR